MANVDPIERTHGTNNPPVSKKSYPIAGILTTVYGLEELPKNGKTVSCLWLLHPRLSKQERMEAIAAAAINAWNERLARQSSGQPHGLIAVSFDQRNHGTRLIDKVANEAWRSGNPRHAQDMFSCFQGTATDTSQLINYLPAYVFPADEYTMTSHMVLGVSLGGHAAWHCILHDYRITSAVVVIGCADYARVMKDRARLSKRETYMSSDPPGSKFMGSTDFPRSLVEALDKYDPAALLMAEMKITDEDYTREPTEKEKTKLLPLMREHLQGKRILNMAGGADKLVPYRMSEPFLKWLKKAIGPNGWFSGRDVYLEDKVYEGAGHEMTPAMLQDAVQFIVDSTARECGGKESKM